MPKTCKLTLLPPISSNDCEIITFYRSIDSVLFSDPYLTASARPKIPEIRVHCTNRVHIKAFKLISVLISNRDSRAKLHRLGFIMWIRLRSDKVTVSVIFEFSRFVQVSTRSFLMKFSN